MSKYKISARARRPRWRTRVKVFIFKKLQRAQILIFFDENWHAASFYIKEQTQKYKCEIWLLKTTILKETPLPKQGFVRNYPTPMVNTNTICCTVYNVHVLREDVYSPCNPIIIVPCIIQYTKRKNRKKLKFNYGMERWILDVNKYSLKYIFPDFFLSVYICRQYQNCLMYFLRIVMK